MFYIQRLLLAILEYGSNSIHRINLPRIAGGSSGTHRLLD